MATLTGNSISSTYTSLLKVGDNSTLASALQSITDGAGNTTGLSMNTGGDLTAIGTVTANAFSGALTGNVTGNLTGNVTGNVTGAITGNVTGNVTGDLTGNADTATALATARTIAGVSFNGTANINLDTDDITEATNKYYTAERVDDQVNTLVQAGTGITKTYDDTAGTLTIANNAPDQTVALTGGTGITASGTYPNFTITNTQPDQTVSLTAGTGITVSGTYPNFTIANSGAGISLTDLSATDAGGLGSFSYDNSSGVFTYTGPSDANVRSLISAVDNGGDGSLSYNSSTGVISYTGPSSSEVQAHITKTYVDSLGIAASTADTLSTARTINGVSFDGSANISFDTDSVSEGTSNLYYTTARFNTAFATKDTADLTEGTNLYYTNERVDDRVSNLVVAGTSISSTYDDVNNTLTIANTAPDQTVALTGGTGISTSGTYPSFTITNDSPDQTVAISAGTGITTSGTYPNFTVTNSAPDQTVSLTQGSNVTITGSYPSFTIAATDTDTTYSAGTGLALAGTTFSLDAGLNNLTDTTITSPAAGHVLIYDNTNSIFENALLTAGSNVSITNADGSITIAATNTDTTYTAGTGLSLTGTTFALDSGINNLTDVNITSAAAGNVLIYDATNTYFENALLTAGSNVTITNADGSITIAASDTNTTYTAGSGLTLSGTEFSLTNNAVTIGGTSVALGAALTATSGSLTIGGNGSSGGVTIDDGSIQMRTGTGNVAEIRMYCETGNAHYQTIKAAPHSASSSAVLTLPTATGTFVATGDTGSVATAMVANDAINYSKLGAEYTTSAAISASDVDWSTAAVHTKTLSANTTLTFSNVSTGMTVDLVISGNYTLTLPASVKEITGTYDGTVANLIQIVSTNGSTEQWATISKEA
tara:strand:- start:92 stop:2746 length:2655 start_codon:yes stop_codon:yes gene_type:complete